MTTTRTIAEPRLTLGNDALRIDFDPRTSDTMYNYLWVRRPDTGAWERPHNFGVDVRAPHADGRTLNLIGMALDVAITGRCARVRYPNPLVQYRQFDDAIGNAATIAHYPDQRLEELPAMVHADGEVAFVYEIDPVRPSYTVSGRVHSGRVSDITYIVSALWTDNHALPTHELLEGFPEIDQAAGIAQCWQNVETEGVAYALFYRRDGRGLPFALLPRQPLRAGICNFFDNWKCLRDFRTSCLNQAYVPSAPAVKDANDTGYVAYTQADGTLPAVRVAFFPELGWGAGGTGDELVERLQAALRAGYLDDARAWNRPGRGIPTRLTMNAQTLAT